MNSLYSASAVQLTAKTTIFRVTNNQTGEFVAQNCNEKACNNLAAYLNRNEISTIHDWNNQPNKVRKGFIVAFNQCVPSF